MSKVRLIDASALDNDIVKALRWKDLTVEEITIRELVASAPTIDPVRHAKWVDAKVNGMGIYPRGQRMCGECNTIMPLEWRVMPPYCFNCGARMDGEEKDG